MAVSANVRVDSAAESRRARMRFYAEVPDSFRIELSGPVGGVAAVVTASGGLGRVVLPSQRLYSEGSVASDLGSAILGIPITGCDLGWLAREIGGPLRFDPCGDVAEDSGPRSLRIDIDRPDPGALPTQVRISSAEDPAARVTLTNLRPLSFPEVRPDGFFREPVPDGAERLVGAADERPAPR